MILLDFLSVICVSWFLIWVWFVSHGFYFECDLCFMVFILKYFLGFILADFQLPSMCAKTKLIVVVSVSRNDQWIRFLLQFVILYEEWLIFYSQITVSVGRIHFSHLHIETWAANFWDDFWKRRSWRYQLRRSLLALHHIERSVCSYWSVKNKYMLLDRVTVFETCRKK